jgi:hypothetical protein
MSSERVGAQSLIDAALASIERDDVQSLAFAIRRAASLGVVDEGLALGTSIQWLNNVSPAIAKRAIILLQQEVITSNEPKVAYTLARAYALGILGVDQNNELAFKYFAQAADLGMTFANIYAGIFAMKCSDSKTHSEAAMYYLEKAADAGFLIANRHILLLKKDISRFKKLSELIKLTVQSFNLALIDPSNPRLFLLNPIAKASFDSCEQ